MLFVFCPRDNLIRQVGTGNVNRMVELGVYEGDFSQFCLETLAPKAYTLVDMWDYSGISLVLEDAPQNAFSREIFERYFKGSATQTLQQAYEKVCKRFANVPQVSILRADLADAVKSFEDASLDLIYLDANHTYEYALRDLYLWFPKLAPGGLFICNDFYESQDGARQNIGVIAAYSVFARRFRTYPVALSAWPFSDFYFSNRPTSDLIQKFRRNVVLTGYNVVEVPDELISNFHHHMVQGLKVRREIPSLRATVSDPIEV